MHHWFPFDLKYQQHNLVDEESVGILFATYSLESFCLSGTHPLFVYKPDRIKMQYHYHGSINKDREKPQSRYNFSEKKQRFTLNQEDNTSMSF